MQAGIVGMGIMGRLLALALHNAGWQVSLFDQNTGDVNCSLAAAGLLTPCSELDKVELPIFHLGQESIGTCWPRIIAQLAGSIYFQRSGSLVLNHPQDKAEWRHFSRRLSSQLRPADAYFQQLSHEAVIQLEPELAKFETAYYFPDEAHIDSQSLMPALKNYLEANGVKCLTNTPVLSLEPRLLVTASKSYEFDMVFDCRGLGARSVVTDLRALRGELIWLHAPDVQLQRPIRLLHPRYSLYIVPRPGNIYLIGASEIEADDQSSISVRTTLELLTAAYYVHAGFAEARIIKTVTHCRPTLSSHLPRIQFTDGLIAINGLYRHGYLIAPALAEDVLRGLQSNYQQVYYPKIWEGLV
ncbi:MAG: FAD-dependent oxidoreductase [Legionellales bacterium]